MKDTLFFALAAVALTALITAPNEHVANLVAIAAMASMVWLPNKIGKIK